MEKTNKMKTTAISIPLLVVLVFGFSACNMEDDVGIEECLTLACRATRSVEEPRYPTVDEIASSRAIVPNMDLAWAKTLADCVPNSRREYGFVITSYGGILGLGIDKIEPGKIADNSTDVTKNSSKISLTLPSNKSNLCGFFHTHTSYEYFHFPCFRLTGPSGDDDSNCVAYGIPGLLYDYDTDTIFNGDPKDAPKTLYTFGPPQRIN